jgi:hypothetical protein
MFELMGDFLQRDLKQAAAILFRCWRLAHVWVRLLGFDTIPVNVTLGIVYGALSIVDRVCHNVAST